MKIFIHFHGRLRYLLIGLAFLLIPVFPLLKIIEAEAYRLIPIILGFMLFGPLCLWVYFDMRKHDLTPKGSSVPPHYVLLFVGAVFTLVGSVFAYLQLIGIVRIEPAEPLSGPESILLPNIFLFLGGFFALLGIAMLFGYVRNRIAPTSPKEVEANDQRVSAIIGGVTGGLTLIGLLVGSVVLDAPWYVNALATFLLLFFGIIGWVLWSKG